MSASGGLPGAGTNFSTSGPLWQNEHPGALTGRCPEGAGSPAKAVVHRATH